MPHCAEIIIRPKQNYLTAAQDFSRNVTIRTMDTRKIDLIIQYALALASEQDEWQERELGPIHLIKYVYLADLAHAKWKGESFTGVRWRFHNFGPWANDVYQRLDPALDTIGAQKKLITSKYNESDYARWSISHSDLVDHLERDIPVSVCGEVRKAVRRFANDTSSLLHYVYQTLPMLTAAPEEELNLFVEIPVDKLHVCSPVRPFTFQISEEAPYSSNNEKRRRKAKIKELKARINQKIADSIQQKEAARQKCKPVYDDVFLEGVKWLDSLAGPPTETFEGVAEIAPTMWKSPARFDPSVS